MNDLPSSGSSDIDFTRHMHSALRRHYGLYIVRQQQPREPGGSQLWSDPSPSRWVIQYITPCFVQADRNCFQRRRVRSRSRAL